MPSDFADWLNNFHELNRLNVNGEARGTMSRPKRRHRLANILEADHLAVIITNYRLQDGIPQDKFSR